MSALIRQCCVNASYSCKFEQISLRNSKRSLREDKLVHNYDDRLLSMFSQAPASSDFLFSHCQSCSQYSILVYKMEVK